jgi:2-C-methyl-D-erythritol 4-phosphate cytidylyltransferase
MGSDAPKQYLPLGGRCLLEHSLLALLGNAAIATVVVALHPEDTRAASLDLLRDPRVRTTIGGEQRADSVLAGLTCLGDRAADSDWVLVHDAARPCLSVSDLKRLLEQGMASESGAILAVPVTDTLKLSDREGKIARTVDRSLYWAAQTPQLFRVGPLRENLEAALASGAPPTDEASAMEQAGVHPLLVTGSSTNIKITGTEDLALAQFILQRQSVRD